MRFLDSSLHIARVWLASLRASLVRDIEFRGNFLLGLFRQTLWLGAFILFVDVMFARTNVIAGWSQAQVLVLLGLSRIVEGMMGLLFVRNIMMFPSTVQQGRFDIYLLRPLPAQYLMAFRLVDLNQFGNILGGIVLLGYALAEPGLVVPLSLLPLFLLLLVCGIAIYYSLLIMVASLVFVLERLEALWSFNILFSEPLTVPFEVFPRGVRVALTYLIPIAFVVWVPATALTGRLEWPAAITAILAAIIFVLLARLIWRAGLRRYTSASS